MKSTDLNLNLKFHFFEENQAKLFRRFMKFAPKKLFHKFKKRFKNGLWVLSGLEVFPPNIILSYNLKSKAKAWWLGIGGVVA